jgi:dTDP-4-dehydrorhamnose 3,5-epimerase-like enzyme
MSGSVEDLMVANPILTVVELPDAGDVRGFSSALSHEHIAHLDSVVDVHVTTLNPGHIRGNHYHADRNELLLIQNTDLWSLHWDSGAGTTITSRDFKSPGAVLVVVPKFWSHAVRNDGESALQIIGMTDGAYDPAVPDAHHRRVADQP